MPKTHLVKVQITRKSLVAGSTTRMRQFSSMPKQTKPTQRKNDGDDEEEANSMNEAQIEMHEVEEDHDDDEDVDNCIEH